MMKDSMITCVLTTLLLGVVVFACDASPTYRAAVVEFEPLVKEGNSDQENLLMNAWRAAEYAEEAGRLGVDIMVFPEYGLLVSFSAGSTREEFASGTQDVPDPKTVNWNPCLQPRQFPTERNEVLRVLSCAAMNHSVAIVANLLGRELCNGTSDPHCPLDGQYLYNTNVVFGNNGTLVARYRKYHLYGEEMLDHPREPEYAIFDLGFAKFGTFVCWDIFYEKPGVELVNKHGVRNLIFSTAWGSELPFITSTQNMAQFAHGVGANLLASNLYFQKEGIVLHLGSGIYSSYNGALNETLDLATPGKMIVADVPVNPPTLTNEHLQCNDTLLLSAPLMQAKPESCGSSVFNWTGLSDFTLTNLPSSQNNENRKLKVYYEPLVNYSYTELTGQEGQVQVCQSEFCCNTMYEFKNRNASETYVLAVRNGCRIVGKYNIGLQVCSVLRCTSSNNISSCGRLTDEQPLSRFKELIISGVFDTKHIFPNVFSTTFVNVPRHSWQFKKQFCQAEHKVKAKLEVLPSFENYPIMVASLYGRMYEWD